jgi:hypothetical protein
VNMLDANEGYVAPPFPLGGETVRMNRHMYQSIR